MMTPQEIREKTFEKAVFGGYDMASVDDFLNELATDYTALSKDNAILKSKLKVLVEKVEEYRATEDTMRLALLSAQKTGLQIENEAKEKASAVVAEAEAQALSILKDVQLQLAEEEERLEKAKVSTAQYIANMRLICNKQLDFFSAIEGLAGVPIPELTDETPDEGDSVAETVRTIESSVARATADPDMDISIDTANAPEVTDEPTRQYKPFDVSAPTGESAGVGYDEGEILPLWDTAEQ